MKKYEEICYKKLGKKAKKIESTMENCDIKNYIEEKGTKAKLQCVFK